MLTSAAIPLEEYLRTTYEPDMEYVAGQLVERHVGEHDHSRLQSILLRELGIRERQRGFRTFAEQRVRVSDEPRFRIPDICIKKLPYRKPPVLVQPELVIEILSPDDEPAELLEKIADYQTAGIPYIWVADPHKRKLMELHEGRMRKPDGFVLSTPLTAEIDFGALFNELDEPSE